MINWFKTVCAPFVALCPRLEPVLLLAIRLWMGEIFLKSGWNKMQDILEGKTNKVVYLFEKIHPVPGVPAEIAAPLATGGELVLGSLFILGLFSRFAAFGLLIIIAVIEYVLSNPSLHGLWGLLVAVILTRGAGLLSADAMLRRIWSQSSETKK